MKKPKKTRKQRRAITPILLPAAIFIGIIGLSLIWIDSQNKKRKHQPIHQKDNVAIMAIPIDEPQKIEVDQELT